MGLELRLASVWFLYLGGLGMYLPFFSLFLGENLGLNGTLVGLVSACLPAVGIVAQPVWGQIADLTGSRTRVLAFVTCGASVGWAAFYFTSGFGSAIAAAILFATFHTSVIPMTFSVTLASLSAGRARHFGPVRAVGTVGFLIFVVGFPSVLDAVQRARGLEAVPGGPSEPGLEVMFLGAALLAGLSSVVAFSLPRMGDVDLRAPRGDWRRLLRHRPYVRLVAYVFMVHVFLHGPMILFPLFVTSQGGSLESVSRMWILMLALEVPLIAWSGRLVGRLGIRGLIAVGVTAGGVRWLAPGLFPSLPLIYAISILHGVVVAGLVIGGPLYVDATVPKRLRSTGQAGLSMFGQGAGAVVSVIVSGVLLDVFGPSAPYRIGGLGALVLGLALPWILSNPERPPAAEGEDEDIESGAGFEIADVEAGSGVG